MTAWPTGRARETDVLRRLASDRPLVTTEIHEPNAYYGHATVLKQYTGRAAWRPLPVAVEHAVYISDYMWDVEADTPLGTILCSSPERAARYRERDPHAAVPVPIGPIAAYMQPLPPRAAGGTLVAFPAHSTHLLEAQFDVQAFIAEIERVRGDFADVRVCIYWKDVLLGRDAPFRAAGYSCVTAGHIYDPRFVHRLRAIFADASAIVTNEVGSHVLYATLWDRPAWVTQQTITHTSSDDDVLSRERASDAQWAGETAHLRSLFAEPTWELNDEQRAHVAWFTGVASVRSPAELSRILDEAAARYRATVPAAERRRLAKDYVLRTARAVRLHPAGARGIFVRGA
jgi:hypothetical protein